MNQTKAPESTPSPKLSAKATPNEATNTDNPTSVFISAALDMSWRLAVVVLVPIIGGFQLDKRLHMTPLLTITGFLLAMGGMAVVLMRMLQQVKAMPVPKKVKQV